MHGSNTVKLITKLTTKNYVCGNGVMEVWDSFARHYIEKMRFKLLIKIMSVICLNSVWFQNQNLNLCSEVTSCSVD